MGRIKVARQTGYYSTGYKVNTDQLDTAIVKAKEAPLVKIPKGKIEVLKENKYARLVKVFDESLYGVVNPQFFLVVKQRKRPSFADTTEEED